MTILILACGLALGVLGAIVWALFHYPHLPVVERLALSSVAGGLVWGGSQHAAGRAMCLGDLLFLAGVALLLWRFYVRNPKIGVVT